MNERITQILSVPVTESVDVLVAGGGIAGVAAALAAARSGKKVLLCEREYLLGGLATIGMVALYLPLDDGRGRQVSFGVAEELMRLCLKPGKPSFKQNGEDKIFYPEVWLRDAAKEERIAQRYEAIYNPYIYAMDLEDLLLKEGVEILYGTWVADAMVKNGVITHVILENIDGRTAVAIGSAVDATGDAVLARAAGEETAVWSYGNARSLWYVSLTDGLPDIIMNSEGITSPDREPVAGQDLVSGLDARENSRFLHRTHKVMRADLAERQKRDPAAQLVNMATIPDLRMTRRIVGVSACEKSHEEAHLSDSIGCYAEWHKCGGAFEMPFGALFGKKIKNLLAAGRCISASDDMWDITRVIPVCAVSGEAAGVAAAMTGDNFSLPVTDLQGELVRRGVRLHLKDC